MDVVSRGITGAFGIAAKRMEHIIGEHQTHMTYPESFPQIRDRLKEKYGLE